MLDEESRQKVIRSYIWQAAVLIGSATGFAILSATVMYQVDIRPLWGRIVFAVLPWMFLLWLIYGAIRWYNKVLLPRLDEVESIDQLVREGKTNESFPLVRWAYRSIRGLVGKAK